MILSGIRFGNVWQASGATNFFENGWWYHKPLKPFGLDFKGSVFVAKTTTVHPRAGNMPLKRDGITPKEWVPQCIVVRRDTGAALNAVGLSGPGLSFLLKQGCWQNRREPFAISLASCETDPMRVLGEVRQAVSYLKDEVFLTDYCVQWNDSCPNVTHAEQDLVFSILDILRELGKPLMIKVGPDCSPERALKITQHPACDSLCAFNTLKWDDLPEPERMQYFGTITSPLEKRLGNGIKGGVSGKPLLPRLNDWLRKVRAAGVHKPICAGGGILNFADVMSVFDAGANAIFLGSIAMLAPTEVKRTIDMTNKYYSAAEEGVGRMRMLSAAEHHWAK